MPPTGRAKLQGGRKNKLWPARATAKKTSGSGCFIGGGLTQTRPKTRPDHPGLSRDSDFRPENSKRTRPDQFRPTFGLLAKSAKSQKADFCVIGGYLFMGPSWVGALGLIFGKVYIVWVCAPRYRPLSCRRNRFFTGDQNQVLWSKSPSPTTKVTTSTH